MNRGFHLIVQRGYELLGLRIAGSKLMTQRIEMIVQGEGRREQGVFKIFCAARTYLKSGRPINSFINVDDSVIGYAYGNDYFGVPRGTAGTTPWVSNFDLMFKWSPKNLPGFLSDRLTVGVDIFNVLNSGKATEVYEYYEIEQGPGELNPRYGIGTSFQTPRHVRFSLALEF